MSYDMVSFTNMLRDRRRRDAYVAALRHAVTPDSVVLDLGAGPGFFSAVAAHLGARRVYAVDLLGAVDAVPELAKINGLDGRLTAHHGDIREIDLPEPPDVVIADLRGVLPLHTSGLELIAEVRERVMAPGGTWLQVRDDLRVALASLDRTDLEAAWEEPGLNLDTLRRLLLSVPRRVQVTPDELVTTAATWASIDYANPDDLRRRRWRGEATVTASRDTEANAVALWFDATLIDGIRHSSEPGDTYTTYGQFTLQLVDSLPLAAGQSATVSISYDRLDSGNVWRWSVATDTERREGNSLAAVPISPAALAGAATTAIAN
jgi:SAM-dependent methyltransferase